MPANTTYKPARVGDFEASKLNYDARGVSTTIPAGTQKDLDLVLADDSLITGAWMIVHDGYFGDTANFQVVDTAGAFTGVPGFVLNQFVSNWYLPPTANEQFELVYPAKVYAGLTLRLVYTSTGPSDVFLAVNYKLHKVLI